MRRNKIRELTPKTALLILIPVLLIIVFIGWASYRFIQPIPPRTLTIDDGNGRAAPLPSSVSATGRSWHATGSI